MKYIRRKIRETPYRLRSQGLCALEVQKKRKNLRLGCIFLLLQRHGLFRNIYRKCALFLLAMRYIRRYYRLRKVIYREISHHFRSGHLNFNSMQEDYCWHTMRIRKNDFWKVSEALLLPADLVLDNNSRTNNEEMLIIFLSRLSCSGTWIDLEKRLGVEYSRMSRIFKVSIMLCKLMNLVMVCSGNRSTYI